MYGKMQASGLTEFIPMNMRLSCLGPNPVSLFTVRIGRWLLLVFPQLLSNSSRGGSIHWITVLGALIHTWKPEITDGCDSSCFLIWQEIFSFHSTNGLGASQVVLESENLLANAGNVKRYGFDLWVGKTSWRRVWQPIPVFLPGKSHGQRRLSGGYKSIRSQSVRLSMHACTSGVDPGLQARVIVNIFSSFLIDFVCGIFFLYIIH